MELSVIIVSFEVRDFLALCLTSVRKAMRGIDAEVIVVDNASTDGTPEYLSEFFPWVVCQVNNTNLGFSRACNIGAAQAGGAVLLFLNPDTVIHEEALRMTLNFLNMKEDGGALGIRMIDGSGRFLPESKRGFPTATASFFKISGLSKLFPKSKTISGYHAGHLSENTTQKVDVLSGAYMMVKAEAFEKAGRFDERYFMYGEDIDLSYTLRQSGYENYYFADCTIIHFKGESSQTVTLPHFYEAMQLFVDKHYSGSRAKYFRRVLRLAIRGSAVAAIFKSRRAKDSSAGSDGKKALLVAGDVNKPLLHQYLESRYSVHTVEGDESPADFLEATAEMVANKNNLLVLDAEFLPVSAVVQWMEVLKGKLRIRIYALGQLYGSDSKKKQGVVTKVAEHVPIL